MLHYVSIQAGSPCSEVRILARRFNAACQIIGIPRSKQQAIVAATPEIETYVENLKRSGRKVTGLALRQLLRLLREYPREPFLAAIAEAAHYGLYDLDRVERMILRRVARDYFLLTEDTENDD